MVSLYCILSQTCEQCLNMWTEVLEFQEKIFLFLRTKYLEHSPETSNNLPASGWYLGRFAAKRFIISINSCCVRERCYSVIPKNLTSVMKSSNRTTVGISVPFTIEIQYFHSDTVLLILCLKNKKLTILPISHAVNKIWNIICQLTLWDTKKKRIQVAVIPNNGMTNLSKVKIDKSLTSFLIWFRNCHCFVLFCILQKNSCGWVALIPNYL